MMPERWFSSAAVIVSLLFAAAGGAEESTPTAALSPEESKTAVYPSLRMNGALRTDYFSSSRTLDDETDLFGATVQVKALPRINEVFDGKVEARLGDTDIGRPGKTTAALIEGYITAHTGNASFTAGKQIVKWGRADSVNPTDNLTPRDFTLLLPWEDDQRSGVVGLKADTYLTPERTLTVFWTPFFEPSKIPLPASPGTVYREQVPARTAENSVVGMKYDKTGGQVDWSMSLVHGYSLFPKIVIASLSPNGSVLDLTYPEMNVLGADAARNFGAYGVRAELAYLMIRDHDPFEGGRIHPYWYYVFGTDRMFFENLNINIQFVGRWTPRYSDPATIGDPAERGLAVQNAITFGQQRQTSYGVTSRIGDRWLNDTLEAELLVFLNFGPANSYLRPLVTYAFTDRVKGTLGAELYTGPPDSYFGRLHGNQGVFAEIRYGF